MGRVAIANILKPLSLAALLSLIGAAGGNAQPLDGSSFIGCAQTKSTNPLVLLQNQGVVTATESLCEDALAQLDSQCLQMEHENFLVEKAPESSITFATMDRFDCDQVGLGREFAFLGCGRDQQSGELQVRFSQGEAVTTALLCEDGLADLADQGCTPIEGSSSHFLMDKHPSWAAFYRLACVSQ